MKKIYLALLACLISLPFVWAQDNVSNRRKQILEQKKNFMTKALDLTPKEADQLMTILDELDKERFKLWKNSPAAFLHKERKAGEGKEHTSEELEKAFLADLDRRVQEAELERTYYKRCLEVLPAKKIVHLPFENRRFAREYLKHLRPSKSPK